MKWVNQLKEAIPDYAKDTRLNLDAVLVRSTLPADEAYGVAVASAFATGNGKLVSFITTYISDSGVGEQEAWSVERDAALAAGSIMAQNNIWYPYVEMADDESLKGLPAQLRMNVIASHGGTTKARFEAYSLAASIIGKCHFCVRAHYETLKQEGYTVEQLRDIGRIASVMNSVAKVLNS
jgi:alkyl hydroperoxide reductase subunit D